MPLCSFNFHLEPRYIGKGHKRCVFTPVKKVYQILFFLSPYKVDVSSSHTCNLASNEGYNKVEIRELFLLNSS